MWTCSRELNANRYRFAAAATLVALLVPTVTAGPLNIETTDECGSEPIMVESVEPWRAGAGDAEFEHFLSLAKPAERLPATREEVDAVRRVWGNRATSFLGADATE